MGMPVLILGESGSGKSCSLRNFTSDEVSVISVAGKPLPFKSEIHVNNKVDTCSGVMSLLGRTSRNCVVIDDSQYLMEFPFLQRSGETGYGKFSQIAKAFCDVIFTIKRLPDDVIVYLLHHVRMGEDGIVRPKTVGKMVDEHLSIEGMVTVCLLARTDGKQWVFQTQSGGGSVAKSPMGMFTDFEVENDLRAVDTTIREYWGIPARKSAPLVPVKKESPAPVAPEAVKKEVKKDAVNQ